MILRRFVTLSCLFYLQHCLAQSPGIRVPGFTIQPFAGLTSGSPQAITSDSSGNLYVTQFSSYGSGLILKISSGGKVSTVAGGGINPPFLGDGGLATSATIEPDGVAVDASGNLYISDVINNRIRKVDANGLISTIAGPGTGRVTGPSGDGGPATSATLYQPAGIAVDSNGNIFVAEPSNNRVRQISPSGIIRTVAGNGMGAPNGQPSNCACGDGGPATSATVPQPTAVATDSAGNLYIADVRGTRIRKVSQAGVISTFAGNGAISSVVPGYSPTYGNGGLATQAEISGFLQQSLAPVIGGMAVDSNGTVYITDSYGGQVRAITSNGIINAVAGVGVTTNTCHGNPNPGASLSLTSGPVPANGVVLYNDAVYPLLTLYGITVGSSGALYITVSNGYVWELLPSSTFVSPFPFIATFNSASSFLGGKTSFCSDPISVSLGGWMEIYGSYLAFDSRSWASGDFTGVSAPTSLDGTSVTIGGQQAFVSYISASQVNVQVPSNIGTGSQPLVVTTANGRSTTNAVTVQPEMPALLSPPSFKIVANNSTHQYAVALFSDGVTYVLPPGAIPGVPSRAAKEGDVITFYGIGFGPTAPSIGSGQVVQGTAPLTLPLSVSDDDANIYPVPYAGLAPGLVGLYQLNVVIPRNSFRSTATPVQLSFSLGAAGRVAIYTYLQ